MSYRALACVCCGCLAGSAQASLFSFASDNDHTSWTFRGLGSGIFNASDPTDPQVLLIDDNNGVHPALSLDVNFEAAFQLQYVASVPIGGGAFVHTYVLSGSFGFTNRVSGTPILTADFADGAFTAIGGAASWSPTGTVQANDNDFGGSVTYHWFGGALPDYGLFPGSSLGPDDMAFTLTVLNHLGAAVGLDERHMPVAQWFSEGSYSGSASNFIPAPGVASLLGLGGLSLLRRKRS